MQKGVIFGLLLLITLSVFSVDVTKYDKIYNSFKNRSLENLDTAGEVYFKKNSLDSALVCFSIISASYNPESKVKNEQMFAHAYNRCGAIYLRLNSYTKALNMFLKALEICEQSGNEKYTSRIYNNIANVYYVFHDYRQAESYCEMAYSTGLKYNDKDIQKTLLNNLIGINCYLEEYSKARKHLVALKALKSDNEPSFNFHYSICNGALKLEERNYPMAINWFMKATVYADSLPNPDRVKYVAYSNLSRAYGYANQFDSALYYLDKGSRLVTSHQNIDLRYECYNDYYKTYRKMGDEKLSLLYKRKHLEIADSVFNAQEFGQIKDMQFLHEMDKIEKQIYRLNDAQILKDNKIASQQLVLRIVICAFAIIATLLLIMFLQNKRLREANSELFNKNLEIIKSEENEKKNRKLQIESTISSTLSIQTPPIQTPSVQTLTGQTSTESGNDEESNLSEIANCKIKYQNSVISDEEKKRIHEAILDVMDNTLEYCSFDFNMEKMAALTNSKSKYVSQVINELYNKNFNVFVNEYRIKEARKRLMDITNYGNFTIASIALGVGFKSNANFNLVFKKVTGITPSVYQMMAKKRLQKYNEPESGISDC